MKKRNIKKEQNKPWLISFGVSKEARSAAKRMAKERGIFIGEFINEIILGAAYLNDNGPCEKQINDYNVSFENGGRSDSSSTIHKKKPWWRFW